VSDLKPLHQRMCPRCNQWVVVVESTLPTMLLSCGHWMTTKEWERSSVHIEDKVMKLFHVRVEVDVMVAAESVEQAEEIVSEDQVDWRYEACNADVSSTEVTRLDQLDEEWQDALPYGLESSSKTCREILEKS